MKCPACQQQTPDHSRFCCHCGAALDPDAVDSGPGSVSRKIEETCKNALDSLEVKAEELRITTIAEIQKNILSWVKIQFWSVTVILGLIIGLLAFFGYQRYSDYIAVIEEKKIEVGKVEQDAIKTILETKHVAMENIDELNQTIAQVETFEKKYSVENLERKLTEYETVFHNIEKLEKQAVQALRDIRMLGNSRYRFIVHVTHGNTGERNREIQNIMQVFDEHGYVIGPEDFKDITADQCQLIFYNSAIRTKAENVVKMLQAQYPKMVLEAKPSQIERDPYLMLIKIPSPTADANCRG